MYISRFITQKIIDALQTSPVVLLSGARQTGKTTLIRHISAGNDYHYITFDDPQFLTAAKADPLGFIKSVKKPVVLDEIQKVPEIFSAIKLDVDENRIPGRYILTGSANPLLIPNLGDSLAGRMEILKLLPLSQAEIMQADGHFIDFAFAEQHFDTTFDALPHNELYKKIMIGGYPPVQEIEESRRVAWFDSYITTILQHDIKNFSRIEGLLEFPKLLQLLGARVGSLLNTAELSRSSAIPAMTLHRYMALLEMWYMITLLKPWSTNFSKRLVKSPKLYIPDSGLHAFLLGIDEQKISDDSVLMGTVFENFVIAELLKQMSWAKKITKAYHFRNQAGIEVDFVIEDRAGSILAIEIKSRATVAPDDFKGIRYLQEHLGKKFVRGFVLYTGNQTIPFGKNLEALPVTALWRQQKNL